jgi:superfamily II DNA or RNA helicase
MVELRPYQAAAERPIRQGLSEHRRILVVSPTGSGKGVQIAWMSAGAVAKGRRVMIVVHRVELVRQTIATLAAMGIPAGIIAAGVRETPEILVQAALVTSLVRPQRLARWAGWAPNLMIVDEAHHLVAKSWQTLIEIFPGAFTVGFTATPLRLDGKGLGRVFGGMVVVATVKELIAEGWLSPVRHYAPAVLPDLSGARVRGGDYVAEDAAEAMRRSGLVGDAIAHYQRLCRGGSSTTPATPSPMAWRMRITCGAWPIASDARAPRRRSSAAPAAALSWPWARTPVPNAALSLRPPTESRRPSQAISLSSIRPKFCDCDCVPCRCSASASGPAAITSG